MRRRGRRIARIRARTARSLGILGGSRTLVAQLQAGELPDGVVDVAALLENVGHVLRGWTRGGCRESASRFLFPVPLEGRVATRDN